MHLRQINKKNISVNCSESQTAKYLRETDLKKIAMKRDFLKTNNSSGPADFQKQYSRPEDTEMISVIFWHKTYVNLEFKPRKCSSGTGNKINVRPSKTKTSQWTPYERTIHRMYSRKKENYPNGRPEIQTKWYRERQHAVRAESRHCLKSVQTVPIRGE